MKINGFNLFSTGKTLPVEVLNLRDGQIIIGKVITASTDEALLEMAGHSFAAKIEGDPELESGAVLKFLVNHDQQGRVLLKITSGVQAQEANNSANVELSGKQVFDPNLQKAITTALTKEGLPATQENIENFTRLLQSFQSKYQQSLPPQILAFITARKLPVNSETIMTGWVFQDTELRNLLWNALRRTGTEQSGTSVLARSIFGMSTKPEEIQTKLETLVKQLTTLIRHANGDQSGAAIPVKQGQTAADGLIRQSFLDSNSEFSLLSRQSLTKQSSEPALRQFNQDGSSAPFVKVANNQTLSQTQTAEVSELPKVPIINEIKQLVSKLTESFDPKDLRDKIEVLLDRNLGLNKAILQENSVNGNYNLIPLLVNDPQNMLHEIMIKWREESSARKDGSIDQVLRMNIPTENLGEIRLLLRTGSNGTQITFKVDNEAIRKYLVKNLTELKESVNRKDLSINVALEPKENSFNSALNGGVDLWI